MSFSNFLLRMFLRFAGYSHAEHTQEVLDSVCSMTVDCSHDDLRVFRACATEIYYAFKEKRYVHARAVFGFRDFVRRHGISVFDPMPDLQEWNAGLFYDLCLAIETSN